MTSSPPFLASPMHSREQRHRRRVLAGVGALLLLSLSPIFGHHLSSRVDAAMMGQDHVLGLCLIALHTLIGPVHTGFHLLLGAGLLYASWDRARAALRIRRILALLPEDVMRRESLNALVEAAGLTRDQVRVVNGMPNPAFTAGWFRPRVFLASRVCDTLSANEVLAVLRHEAEHVRKRDPLRLSTLRFFACALFWIPAFRRLSDDVADEAEIAADDAAARHQPLALASAILALASWTTGDATGVPRMRLAPTDIAGLILPHAGAVALRYDVLLDRRVRRLAGEPVTLTTHLTRRSLVGAMLTLCAVWVSGVIVAHPMPVVPAGARALHCQHAGASALTHLFCLTDAHVDASLSNADGIVCPHAALRAATGQGAHSLQ